MGICQSNKKPKSQPKPQPVANETLAQQTSQEPSLGPNSWVREAKSHTHTFFLIHGFTGQGDNFKWSVGDMTKSKKKYNIPENIRLVCPTAPMIPTDGFEGVHKKLANGRKEIHSWDGIKKYPNQKKEQLIRIKGLLDIEVALLGGDSTKVFIIGHSQGCDMAIRIGLMYDKELGGIVGLQGGVYGNNEFFLSKEN